jgi:GntR family transcriptional regulator, transcriptional repressor for pyruvate dehydrogenase complex
MPARSKSLERLVLQPRPDLSSQLSEQILELIVAQDLKAGDRLPTMKELARTYSVATPTIREALRRLQAIGAVSIRHGSGIYVRKVEQGLMIANPHFGGLGAGSILQLLDARLLIEPYLAGKAAENADDGDIERLEGLLDEAEHLLNGQDDKLHPVNMRFHLEIARISGNFILAQMFESLIELYSQEQLGILAIFNARTRDYRDHVLIFGAIRDHEASLASSRMSQHLKDVRSVVEARLFTADNIA